MDALGQPHDKEGADKPSLLGQIQNTVQSLQRFAKQLSR